MKNYIALVILLFVFFIIAGCTDNDGLDTDAAKAEGTGAEEEEHGDQQGEGEQSKKQLETLPDNNGEDGTEPGTEGMFWKTSYGENTVYMLGSFHVGTESMYPLKKETEEAFLHSDYLVLEYDFTTEELDEIISVYLEMQFLEDGAVLGEELPEELYQQILDVLPEFGLMGEDVNALKPWSVYVMLEELWTQKNYDFDLGVEEYFLGKMPDDMNVKGLEAEFPPFVFDQIPLDEQEELLRRMVHRIQKGNENIYDEALDYWKEGNTQAFEEWVEETHFSRENLNEFQRLLLTDRNEEMAESIRGFLESEEENTYFVIAGAAHFFGPQNIIQLLQEQGFLIEQPS